jgi:putative NADPH-quinone reductase
MKILVVFCHPIRESFAGAVLDHCTKILAHAGHEVVVKDLYREGFDPVISAEERKLYEDVEHNQARVSAEVATLRSVRGLLLIYPTWWYGMPAMLKGWFDRVWLPGVVFGLDPRRGITVHGLAGIDRLMVVTTYGAPRWFIRLWMGDPGRKVVLRGFRPLLAKGCRSAWAATYAMDNATPRQLSLFLDKAAAKLAIFRD